MVLQSCNRGTIEERLKASPRLIMREPDYLGIQYELLYQENNETR